MYVQIKFFDLYWKYSSKYKNFVLEQVKSQSISIDQNFDYNVGAS